MPARRRGSQHGAREPPEIGRPGHRVVLHIDITGPDASLALRLSGTSLQSHLGRVRRRMAAWLADSGVDGDTIDAVVLATHEALANAADHAFPSGCGEIWVRAERDGSDGLSVVVRDSGRWRPPPTDPGTRGHGMTLMAGLAQRCRVHRTCTGTTVELYWGSCWPA